jgi:hypothetical protein
MYVATKPDNLYNTLYMQALNHAVFGSLIAVTINEPALAIPLALGSHFVMDSIPHYGEDPKMPRGSKSYYVRILADLSVSALMVLFFLSLHPVNPALLILCALAAVMPDFLWPLALVIKQKGPLWAFFVFHKRIQTESRSGIFIEAGWFVVTSALVIIKIRLH